MTAQPTPDEAKAEVVMGELVGDLAGTMATLLSVLGDHLGLLPDLAAHGPSISAELAERTGVHERYARAWLSLLASAGSLAYDPAAGRFTLPPERAAPLAHEGGLPGRQLPMPRAAAGMV